MKNTRRSNSRRRQQSVTVIEAVEDRILLSAITAPIPEPASIDGVGNNLAFPYWGAANEELVRLTEAEYADGIETPAGANRPSARVVSNEIAAQLGTIPNNRYLSDYVWVWGQFVDHDLDLSEGASPAEPFPIQVPAGDPYFDPFNTGTVEIGLNRTVYADPAISSNGQRQQINQITSYIDASNVYGSDSVRAAELRSYSDGKLKMSDGQRLPYNVNGLPNAGGTSSSLYLAGDVRANENLLLTSMHTIWVREHNRVADLIKIQDGSLTDEQIYQAARARVTAEIQAITYNEFLPALFGLDSLPDYIEYQDYINPAIANEFSTAAYRLGHSLLSSELIRLDANGDVIPEGNIPLQQAFFRPDKLDATGIEPLLRGAATQVAQELDNYVIDDVRNFLFGPPGAGGFDLASLNIQRGRDHGLPDYNQVREDYGLARVTDFSEITSDPELQYKLEQIYGDVNSIDVWVGGLAEDHLPGSSVGELFQTIVTDQFLRLRDGDRFYYANRFSGAELDEIHRTTLKDVIERNADVSFTQDNIFFTPDVWTVELESLGSTSVTLRVTNLDVQIIDTISRAVLWSRPDDVVSQLRIVGSDAVNEKIILRVDVKPSQLPGGVIVDGGDSPGDVLVVRATPGDDHIVADGHTLAVDDRLVAFGDIRVLNVQGLNGNDYIDLENLGYTTVVRIMGGSGNDYIVGSAMDDTIRGEGGNDTILGLGDSDNIDGGSGADLLIGGEGLDYLLNVKSNDVAFQEDLPLSLQQEILAAEANKKFNLYTTANDFENWGGLGEKWLMGGRNWYFIKPDGSLFRWDGSNQATGTWIANVGPQYHANLSLLADAMPPLLPGANVFDFVFKDTGLAGCLP